MSSTTPTPITDGDWTLNDETGAPVMHGQTVTSFKGETCEIVGGRSPAGFGKSGYVWTAEGAQFYPSVFDLRWTSPEGRFFGDGKS